MATAEPDIPPRTRDRHRRSKIVEAATTLFQEKGFHGVGIDEIGVAAGITGPGVYRHFGGKDDLLVAVIEEATDDLWRDLAHEEHPALESYVRSHVAYAVRHTVAIELWYQEGRHLPEATRSAQRRLQRRYLERWVDVLLDRRPEIDDQQARVIVQAAVGLIHSAAQADRDVPAEMLGEVLERMALAALLA